METIKREGCLNSSVLPCFPLLIISSLCTCLCAHCTVVTQPINQNAVYYKSHSLWLKKIWNIKKRERKSLEACSPHVIILNDILELLESCPFTHTFLSWVSFHISPIMYSIFHLKMVISVVYIIKLAKIMLWSILSCHKKTPLYDFYAVNTVSSQWQHNIPLFRYIVFQLSISLLWHFVLNVSSVFFFV